MYFAEVGSCHVCPAHGSSPRVIILTLHQVEFKYLARLTGDARYWKAADKVTRIMKEEVSRLSVTGLSRDSDAQE